MLRQAGSPARASFVRTRTVGVVFALGAERSTLSARRDGRGVSIALYQSGPGSARAGRAAAHAIDEGAAAIVSWGLAGGLVADVRAGHVVVPCRVLRARGEALPTDAAWQARLVESLAPRFAVHGGDLLGVEQVLAAPEDKAAAAREFGAIAADMESHAIVEAARAAGIPVAVVRAVADEAGDRLPSHIERFIDEAGRTRLSGAWPLLGAPSQWPLFLRLVRRSRRGLGTLAAVAEHLAGFALDSGSESAA
jgi:adenosylhomocysteine nucleosidase